MLANAYPGGLARDDPDYPAVVATLASQCSTRNAATILELVFGIEHGVSYNEVLKYAGSPPPSEDLTRVHARLIPHGFEEWLAED